MLDLCSYSELFSLPMIKLFVVAESKESITENIYLVNMCLVEADNTGEIRDRKVSNFDKIIFFSTSSHTFVVRWTFSFELPLKQAAVSEDIDSYQIISRRLIFTPNLQCRTDIHK